MASPNIIRDSNPFRQDSYDLSGPHHFSQMKVNNFMGGSSNAPNQLYPNEFKDAHYRQSLTGSKAGSHSLANRTFHNGQSYSQMFEAKK